MLNLIGANDTETHITTSGTILDLVTNEFIIFNRSTGSRQITLFPSEGNDFANVCISHIGYDGTTWYGFSKDYVSTIYPTHANDGTPIYAFEWNASGNFRIRWGTSGDTKLTGINEILVYPKNQQDADVAIWSDINKQYEFDNLEWATNLIQAYNDGDLTKGCFGMEGLPELFIHYTYEAIETGNEV